MRLLMLLLVELRWPSLAQQGAEDLNQIVEVEVMYLIRATMTLIAMWVAVIEWIVVVTLLIMISLALFLTHEVKQRKSLVQWKNSLESMAKRLWRTFVALLE